MLIKVKRHRHGPVNVMEIGTTDHLDAMTNRVRWSEVYHVLKKAQNKTAFVFILLY